MPAVLSVAGKEALDNLVASATKDPKVPGFIFGATTTEGEIYFNGGGYKILDDPSSGEITPESVFWICSQTKMITHLVALELVERGQLNLDDPVTDYVPQFTNLIVLDDIMKQNPSYTPAKEIVKIKHLLHHTSGMFYPWKDVLPGKQVIQYSAPQNKDDPIGEFFKYIKGPLSGIQLRFEPGTNFSYGFSSDVLGFVIESVTKVTLEHYFKKHIFDPLGMKSTSFYLSPDLKERQVGLTIRKDDKVELYDPNVRVYETDPENVFLRLGGVGLYSTPRDYLTLLRHLLQIHAGTASSNPVFSKEVVARLFTPALDAEAEKSISSFLTFVDPFSPWEECAQWSSGIALNKKDWPGRRKKGSGQWFGWANTRHFIDPTTGVAAVFDLQMLPTSDPDMMKYAAKFETTLYSGLQ